MDKTSKDLKTMRILHLSTSLEGGAGLAARRLNAALNSSGLDSKILSLGKNTQILQINEYLQPRNLITKFRSSLLTFLQFRLAQSGNNLVTSRSISTFNPLVVSQSYDVIHVHATYNFINDSVLNALFDSGAKLFFTMHDQRLFTGGCHYSLDCLQYKTSCESCPQVKSPFKRQVKLSHERRVKLFARARRVNLISPSIWLANLAKSSRVLDTYEISILLNPVPEFYSFGDPEKLRLKFGYAKNEIVINFIAANLINANKGLSILFEAILSVDREKRARLRLVLIGNSQQLKIPQGVDCEVLEHQSESETALRLRAGDVLIVPSKIDNSPNVIGEALMAGSMVFGAAVGGISEIMEEMNFRTFPSGDCTTLAEILNDFEPTYDKNEIIRKAKALFSYDVIGDKFKNLYLSQFR